eukprot:c12700_g2_i1.p1 GENE.c12700_g2_i1~~c12700_g2_i1.p1  ORF type:complete len:122 (+),score=16.42 c12700_g2_i1:335-700(+)
MDTHQVIIPKEAGKEIVQVQKCFCFVLFSCVFDFGFSCLCAHNNNLRTINFLCSCSYLFSSFKRCLRVCSTKSSPETIAFHSPQTKLQFSMLFAHPTLGSKIILNGLFLNLKTPNFVFMGV